MELFGFKIERIRPEEIEELKTVHEQLSTVKVSKYIPLSREIQKYDNPLWDRIVWPDFTYLDPIIRLGADNLKLKWLKRDSFDICIFHDLERLGVIILTRDAKDLKEQVTPLHCLDYKHMPPEVLTQLPDLITQIFAASPLCVRWQRRKDEAEQKAQPRMVYHPQPSD